MATNTLSKKCSKCKRIKSIDEFSIRKDRKNAYNSWCNDCLNTRARQRHNNNKLQENLSRAYYRDILRIIVLQVYSQNKMCCELCGEDDLDVLTIDHIDGNGAQHRKNNHLCGGEDMHKWIIDNEFPDGLRVLCRNCNTKEWLRLKSNINYRKWKPKSHKNKGGIK